MNNPNVDSSLLAEIRGLLDEEVKEMAAIVVENIRGARDSDIAWCRSSLDVPSTGGLLQIVIRLVQILEPEDTDADRS